MRMKSVMPTLAMLALAGCTSIGDLHDRVGIPLGGESCFRPFAADPSPAPYEVMLTTDILKISLSDSSPCIEEHTEVGVYRSLSARPISNSLWSVSYAVRVIERQRILGAVTKVVLADQAECRIVKEALFEILFMTVDVDTRRRAEVRGWDSWSGHLLIVNVERGEPNFHDYHLARSTSITDVWDRISAGADNFQKSKVDKGGRLD